MRTASTNKKVREIITAVKGGRLIPRPEFQRRLVWAIKDKNHFLDSVLKRISISGDLSRRRRNKSENRRRNTVVGRWLATC